MSLPAKAKSQTFACQKNEQLEKTTAHLKTSDHIHYNQTSDYTWYGQTYYIAEVNGKEVSFYICLLL